MKDRRLELLEPILTRLESNHSNVLYIMHTQLENIEYKFELSSITNQSQELRQSNGGEVSSCETNTSSVTMISSGFVERAEKLSKCQGSEPLLHQSILEKLKTINDPKFLVKRNDSGLFELLRNYFVYFLIRLMILKFTQTQDSAKG